MTSPSNPHRVASDCPMDRSHLHCSLDKAFTLIELLVVITIIAVLAGLLLPVASKVMTNAQKVQALNTETQIVTAIKSFQTEYGVYPIPTDSPANADICFGAQAPTEAELFNILRALETGDITTMKNTRKIVYIDLPNAKNQTQGLSRNGLGPDGLLYDPWGTIFLIGVDGDYDESIDNPYGKNAGLAPLLRTGVIVYSYGPDQQSSSEFFTHAGDKNDAKSKDDVISWQ